ncbi:MAG TPA: hypothetical protein VMQ86_12540 [Bryobacteraceae bacterium]|jgi:hypothetical protein|nr:hypothetical protein [Bryobacteraceae bacterium]
MSLKTGKPMDQMSVSTVREALRRMEDEDARVLRLARPTAEDVLSDLTGQQLEDIRRCVRASVESMDACD